MASAALLLTPSLADAANIQVDYSGAPGQRDVQIMSTAAPVADGNTVAIGYFDTSGGFDVAANAASFSVLLPRWNAFDAGTIRTLAGETGRFAEMHSADLPAFSNEPIYLWAFDTTTEGAPAAFANPAAGDADIEAYGLFTAPGWMFPDTTEPNPVNRQIEITTDAAGLIALYGGVTGPVDTGMLVLAPVPEPSSALLIIAAWGVALLRRRRGGTMRRSLPGWGGETCDIESDCSLAFS